MLTRDRSLAVLVSLQCGSCYIGDVPEGCGQPISPLDELVIVDDSVLAQVERPTRSPTRFGGVLKKLLPRETSFDLAVEGWVDAWSESLEARGPAMRKRLDEVLICQWLKRDAQNACNDDCADCTTRHFDPELAPLRLVAIVYRPDLDGHPDLAGARGEARLVYGSDDPLEAFAVIVEFPLEAGFEDWSRRFHGLAREGDTSLARRLTTLVHDFSGPHGRVRTLLELDEASAPMHEFRWNGSTRRVDVEPLLRVPKDDADLADLADVLQEQRESVLRGTHVLPRRLRAPYADALVPPPAPSTDRDLLESFHRETCNGCHSRALGSKDRFFHISPHRQDEQKLSQFFGGEDGDLEVRARALGDALCE